MSNAGITALGTICLIFSLLCIYCLYRLLTGYSAALAPTFACLLVAGYTGVLVRHFMKPRNKPSDDDDE